MANWNLMAKLFSTLGLTAFGVGFTGMTVKGRECRDPSIFCGGFGFPANNYNTLNYDITNPYAFLNANINPTNSLMRTGTPSSVRKTQSGLPPDNISELKTNVGKAQEFLQEHLTNLSDADLEKLGISSAKRDRLLEYIKNVKFEDNPYGAARAEGNSIIINSSCSDTDNLANMVTLLIHEANHCDYNQLHANGETAARIDTREEETDCERLGLLTSALLIKNGDITGCDNYGRYPQIPRGSETPVTEYLDKPELLEQHLNNWLDISYRNMSDNLSGDITIQHGIQVNDNTKIEIKSGDIIKIGNEEFPIGQNGIFLEGIQRTPIMQFVNAKTNPPTNLIQGNIIFDDIVPTREEKQQVNKSNITPTGQTVEVIRNGKVIYTGKVYK